jgi:hypothetical protein
MRFQLLAKEIDLAPTQYRYVTGQSLKKVLILASKNLLSSAPQNVAASAPQHCFAKENANIFWVRIFCAVYIVIWPSRRKKVPVPVKPVPVPVL